MRKYMNRWVIPLSRLPHLPGLPNLKLNRLYFIKLVLLEFRSIKKGLLGSSKKVYAREW